MCSESEKMLPAEKYEIAGKKQVMERIYIENIEKIRLT